MNLKRNYFTLLVLSFCLLLCSCNNKEDATNTDLPSSLPVSETEVTPKSPSTTPNPSPLLNQSSPTPDIPELLETLTYQTYQLNDKLTVYISTTKEKPHIVISNQSVSCAYDWEYNLDYGEPIIKLDRNSTLAGEALYIILPTSKNQDILAVKEICGEVYVLDPSTLQETTYSDDIAVLKDWISARITQPYDGLEATFTLEIGLSWVREYTYPGIDLPKMDSYPLVIEDLAYFSDSLYEYRQVGVQLTDDILWLGKFCDDITLLDSSDNYIFLPYQDIVYTSENGLSSSNPKTREEQILAGNMIMLDPNDALDLDQNGVMELINYRNLRDASITDQYNVQDFSLSINDETISYQGTNLDNIPYAGSLDGKSIQLIIFENGSSADPLLNFYQYKGNELSYAGSIPSYEYTLSNGEITAYCESVHLQCFRVLRKFSYQNGEVKEIEQEFYEQGNTVTVLQDFTLYENKEESTLGIKLTKGSEVIIVGSDLKEWVYIQDVKSGNYGWLKTTDHCLLPDGRELPSWELFDGLYFYG